MTPDRRSAEGSFGYPPLSGTTEPASETEPVVDPGEGELLQGTARSTEPDDFPPGYWDRFATD